jgi:hypothetical protein
MVTYEDCLALADLTPEEVDLVATRERVPVIVALGLACHLARTVESGRPVRRIGGGTGAARGAGRAAIPARVPGPRTRRLAA